MKVGQFIPNVVNWEEITSFLEILVSVPILKCSKVCVSKDQLLFYFFTEILKLK